MLELIKQVEDYIFEQESDVVNGMFVVVGFSFVG